jgi:hypothetical protein
MDTNITPTTTQYQPITVQVPEDRIAEFHAFFARFLAGPTGRGRRGRHGRPDRGHHGHHGHHGRRCGDRREAGEQSETSGQPVGTTEL